MRHDMHRQGRETLERDIMDFSFRVLDLYIITNSLQSLKDGSMSCSNSMYLLTTKKSQKSMMIGERTRQYSARIHQV